MYNFKLLYVICERAEHEIFTSEVASNIKCWYISDQLKFAAIQANELLTIDDIMDDINGQ